MEAFFSTSFSDLGNNPPRNLTSGNKRSVDTLSDQFSIHNIETRLSDLYKALAYNNNTLTDFQFIRLTKIDNQVTDIMLSAEWKCACKQIPRQPWSPTQRSIARTFAYWKQKATMSKKKIFHWDHLDKL